jgi:hypothetical protein
MPEPVRIELVKRPSQVEAFIRFPFQLYRERGRKVVGTIAAVRNDRYAQFHPHEEHVGFFGLYEAVDDPEVSEALLDAAAGWIRAESLGVMRGPVNLTTNDVMGLLVEGFDDDPALLMPYNPPYYAAQLEAYGLAKVKDLLALEVTGAGAREGRLDKFAKRLLERGRCRIRPVDLSRFREELEFVRRCYNEAWAGNWGFVPWSDSELEFLAKELKPLIDPRLTFVAEVEGQPAGICIAVPDANQALKLARGRLFPLGLLKLVWKLKVRGCTRMRVAALGVLPQHRRLGLDAAFIHHLIENGIRMGMPLAEVGWVLEDNEALLRPLERIGARKTKIFRIYEKGL